MGILINNNNALSSNDNILTGDFAPTAHLNITTTNELNVEEYGSAQIVDADIVAENIKKDVTILGVTGTCETPAAPTASGENITFTEGAVVSGENLDI